MTAVPTATVEAIFAQVVDLDPAARGAEVRRLASGDDALAREVLDLLSQLDDDEFLDPERFAREQSGLMFEGMLPVAARIAQYTVLGVLGAGGMGTVYLAEQARPRRQVALKVIAGPVAQEAMVARFEREADLLGRLSHPGIAQIFEAGVADYGLGPRPFIAMERIEGEPISAFARRRSLSARECAALLAKVADAIEHAHLRGVIHRDLKPGNILVTQDGEPKVVDFGVARAVDEEFAGGATATGGVLGTLSYMAPEQLRESRSVDTRADIYALGVILFELLTGRQPHDCKTGALTDILRRVCDEPAPRLGAVDRALKGELETIVACALEKDRERRYRSAADFADDLRRWLRGEPIAARRDSLLDALGRSARRNRRIVLVGAGALAIAIVGGAWATAQAARNARLANAEREAKGRAEMALSLAQRERERADHEASRLRDRLYSSNIGFAQAAVAGGDNGRAQRLLAQCPPDQRGWEWRYLSSITEQSDRVVRANLEGAGYLAADASHGRFAAARFGEPAKIYDADTGAEVGTFDLAAGVFRLAYASDGTLFVADAAGRLEARAPGAERPVVLRAQGAHNGYYAIRGVGGGEAIVASGDSLVQRLGPGERVAWSRDDFAAAALAVAEDHDLVVCGGVTGGVRALRATDGAPRWSADEPREEVRGVTITSDGRRVATVSRTGRVDMVDAIDGRPLWTAQVDASRSMAVCAVDDAGLVLVGCNDGSIIALDLDTGAPRGRLRGHGGAVTSIERLGPGRVASYGRDGEARVWTVLGGVPADEFTLEVDSSGLCGLASYEDRFLGASFGARVYDLSERGATALWSDAASAAWRMAVSEAAGLASVARSNGSVVLVPLDGSAARVVSLSAARVPKSAFSPDGRLLAAACDSGEVFIVNTRDGAVLAGAHVSDKLIVGVAWDPHGDAVWTTGDDGALRRLPVSRDGSLDAAHPTVVRALSEQPLWEVAVSSDGVFVAACGAGGTVHVFDTRNGETRELPGHTGEAFGLAFHPTERRLASVGADGRLRLWDVVSGEQLLQLGAGGPSFTSVTFDTRGERVAAGGADGAVRVWSAARRSADAAQR